MTDFGDNLDSPDAEFTYGCPRCSAAVVMRPDAIGLDAASCPTHLDVPPLRQPHVVSYATLAPQLMADFPTLAPWPMSPEWLISDFCWVGEASSPLATLTSCYARTDAEGELGVVVVLEQPGVGLGARVAGLAGIEPPPADLAGAPALRVQAESASLPLWELSIPGDEVLDRMVAVGQWSGRWLWIVWQPAAAALARRGEWGLRDLRGVGPALLSVPFGGPRSLG